MMLPGVHLGHQTVEHVQVAAADAGGRHPDDGVLGVLDRPARAPPPAGCRPGRGRRRPSRAAPLGRRAPLGRVTLRRRPSDRASTTYSSSLAMQPVTPRGVLLAPGRWRRPPWCRAARSRLLLLLGGPHAHALGADDLGGHDGVHGDVVTAHLGGQGPGEAVEAGLGGGVDGAVAHGAGAPLGAGVAR